MTETTQAPEMNAEMISRIGAELFKLNGKDQTSDIELLDDAFETHLWDLANEFAETVKEPASLIGFGVVFALEASEIIRTQPAPVALEMLENLVSEIEAKIQSRIDEARKEAA